MLKLVRLKKVQHSLIYTTAPNDLFQVFNTPLGGSQESDLVQGKEEDE